MSWMEIGQRDDGASGWDSAAHTATLPSALQPEVDDLRRIGRYDLVDLIGSGAFGRVYAASDPRLGRNVAVKLLRGRRAGDDQARFSREARALARINHPHVLPIYDYGVEAKTQRPYLVTELIDGGTLRNEFERGVSVSRLHRLMRQAGLGLLAAHAVGLLHRDFKPDNVLVGRDGRVRVADFGLVGIATEPQRTRPDSVELGSADDESALHLGLTGRGALMGTPAYMAPELRRGGPASERSDQYAFALTWVEGLTGSRPAKGTDGRLDLSSVSDVAPQWMAPLQRALSFDPQDRHADLSELLEALGRRGHKRRIWVAGFGAVAALSLLGWSVSPAPCHGLATDDASWTLRVTEVQARLSRTDATRASAALEDSFDSWIDTREQICAASDVAPSVIRCLTSADSKRVALVDAWLSQPGDADVLLQAIEELPNPEACLDAPRNDTPTESLPGDATAQRMIDRASAQLRLGRPDAALQLLVPLTKDPTGQVSPKFRARAKGVAALALMHRGDREDGLRVLTAAAHESYQAGLDALAAETASELCMRRCYDGNLEEARRWSAMARAALYRANMPRREGARVALCQASLASRSGDPTRAGVILRDLADREGVDTDEGWMARLSLAHLLLDTQRYAEAREAAQPLYEALDANELPAGKALPVLALRTSEAMRPADPERARAELEHALALAESISGPRSSDVAVLLSRLAGLVGGSLGDYEAAIELRRRVLSIREELGARDSDMGEAMVNLANDLADAGHLDEAARLMQQALVRLETAWGADHPDLLTTLTAAIAVANDRRALDEARRLGERALEVLDRLEHERPATEAYLRAELSRLARAQGNLDTAVRAAAKAHSLRLEYDPRPGALAYAELLEARARWARNDSDDREVALALADAAIDHAERGLPTDRAIAEQTRRWLREIDEVR